MSLLLESMETCVMLDRHSTPDGYGGMDYAWEDGAEFDAAIVLDTSLQARIAEKQGVTALYTVTTSRSINLQFNDYFRRLRDNKIFRVKTDGDDNLTPKSAALNMRQVNAEETVLPHG